VSPTAQLDGPSVQIFATPHAVEYPEATVDSERSLLSIEARTSSDVLLASTYGQFLGAPWRELRQILFTYSVDLGSGLIAQGVITIREPVQGASSVVAPVLGPPTRPRINGMDAFASHSGVGLQPVLSWTPPRLGSPTSYLVIVKTVGGLQQEGDTDELSAIVDGATSFRIPPGFLKAGQSYFARITARQAPWDDPGRLPLRLGTPLATADCLTGVFSP
jgi:hypothetical protein